MYKNKNKMIAGACALTTILAGGSSAIGDLSLNNNDADNVSYVKNFEVNAKTSNKEMKTTASLNIRSGAGTKYKVLGTLKKGQKITVTSTSNGWAKFKYKNKNAYVSTKYLKAVTTSSNSNTNTGNSGNTQTNTQSKSMQTTANLNVRSGAGTKYKVLGTLKKSQKIDVLSTSNGWAKINYNGKTGYVSALYLKNAVTESTTNNNNNNNNSNAGGGNTNTGTNTDTNSNDTSSNNNVTYRKVNYSTLYNTLMQREGWTGLAGSKNTIGFHGEAIIVSKNLDEDAINKDLLTGIGVLNTSNNQYLTDLKNQELTTILNIITNSESTTNSILNDMNNNSTNFTKVYGDLKLTITYHAGACGIVFNE